MVGLHVIEYSTYFGFRGYGDSHGDSNGDSCGYGMGMGIEMPSPRQPWNDLWNDISSEDVGPVQTLYAVVRLTTHCQA